MRRFLVFTFCWLVATLTHAQVKTIESFTQNMKKTEGFLPLYWDESTGKLWAEITQLDREFLYYPCLSAGVS